MSDIDQTEAAKRIALAKSLLNHRPANSSTIDITIAALEGADITDLMTLEEAA